MAISLNPVYTKMYETDRRYILLTGGRGGAKSFEASTFLCLLTYDKLQKILFTRYTMTAAEISIIPEFRAKIENLEVGDAFNVGKSEIKNLTTGNEILFRGIKTSSGVQTANLKSIAGISCWCNDESEELVDEDTFDTIDLSVRTKGVQNRVILILNPSDKTHWIYKKWIDGHNRIEYIDGYPVEISTHPDVLHIHTTYLDNLKNLDESFIKIAQRMKEENPVLYGYKMMGQWREANEGAIFPKNKLRIYEELPKQFDKIVAYIDTADEGDDFLSMPIAGIKGTKIYILDIVFSNANTDVTLPLCVSSILKYKVSHVRCEANNMGAMFKRNLEKELHHKGIWIGGATSTSNKFARIYNDAMFILDCFTFPMNRTAQQEAALTQLAEFTRDGKAKHDDVADSLSGLAIFIRGLMPGRWI